MHRVISSGQQTLLFLLQNYFRLTAAIWPHTEMEVLLRESLLEYFLLESAGALHILCKDTDIYRRSCEMDTCLIFFDCSKKMRSY